MTLVTSRYNLSDALTRVPQKWLKMVNERELPSQDVCAATADPLTAKQIAEIHHATGHYGIRGTLYFFRKMNPGVSRKEVQLVVQSCQACQSIDPTPV